MWYENENGENVRPSDIDTTSSKVYVYVRKNFKLIPEKTEEDETYPAHYSWLEMKIPKEMWEVCKMALSNESALNDVYDALAELADMIVEVTG